MQHVLMHVILTDIPSGRSSITPLFMTGIEALRVYRIKYCSLDPEAALWTMTLLACGQEPGAPCNRLRGLQEAGGSTG